MFLLLISQNINSQETRLICVIRNTIHIEFYMPVEILNYNYKRECAKFDQNKFRSQGAAANAYIHHVRNFHVVQGFRYDGLRLRMPDNSSRKDAIARKPDIT